MIKAFALGDVVLKDEFFTQVTQKDVDFLNTFEVDRLLYNFRVTAGVANKAAGPYNGWENTRIGGHTLGHYLTAAAQGVAGGYGGCKGSDGHSLCERLSLLVNGLAECQKALGTGFIFGATMEDPAKPELQFDKMEAGTYADTWVPWYTMHKILNGLVETAKIAREGAEPAGVQISERALDVAEKLGEWIYNRTSRWTSEQRDHVLAVEYGAMNDCLYELYKTAAAAGYETADHFMKAAHAFDEEKLFDAVLAASREGGEPDVLNNKHANCTIPKFVGAINRCVTLLEEGREPSDQQKYLEYCKAFWNIVTERHTYITGGNSECEHFGRDNILDAERSNCNCETCNTHNMLKLTRTLFMLTGKKKYADYYENTFVNAILASVNRETGMTTYFQPMATGCFKTYCNIDVNKNYFWCCTGTGLENFTKLGDSIYFYDDDTLYVNQYVSSVVNWKSKGVVLSQTSALPEAGDVELCVKESSGSFTLALRIPDWAIGAGVLKVCVNGKAVELSSSDFENGYIRISRDWKSGDVVSLFLPMEVRSFSLPDNPRCCAFKYGPVVLAAELGRDDKMSLRQVGVQCDVCANKIVRGLEMPLNGNYGGTSGLKPLATETLLVKSLPCHPGDTCCHTGKSDCHPEKSDCHPELVSGSSLKFVLNCDGFDTASGLLKGLQLTFSPYYRINNQRYGIYWNFTDSEEELRMLGAMAQSSAAGAANYIEGIGVGYGAQTEGNDSTWPFMKETGAGSVADPHELTRYAKAGGSFSYMFKILPDADKKIYLDCTFLKADEGKSIRITSGDVLIAEYTLSATDGEVGSEAGEKFTKSFELPASLTNGRKELRIEFSGKDGVESARLAAPVSTSWK